MTIAERIYDAARVLPEDVQQEILDFTLFLTQKQKQEDAPAAVRALFDEATGKK